jgi:hypothetical protein
VIAAIRHWHHLHDEVPRYVDWDPSRARRRAQRELVDRFEAGDWPTVRIVCGLFGSLNVAIEASGLTPRPSAGRKANLVGPEAVLDAIRAWTVAHGDPPARTDWDPYRARASQQAWRAERYEAGDWPSLPTVRRHFGGLAAATHAAGLEAAPQSETPHERATRRRRNRLALIEHLAPEHERDMLALRRAVESVARARADADEKRLEWALLNLSSRAYALAETYRAGRLPVGSA